MDYNDKSKEDLISMLRCLEIALSSNYKWCLDCKREDCIVQIVGALYKNY